MDVDEAIVNAFMEFGGQCIRDVITKSTKTIRNMAAAEFPYVRIGKMIILHLGNGRLRLDMMKMRLMASAP